MLNILWLHMKDQQCQLSRATIPPSELTVLRFFITPRSSATTRRIFHQHSSVRCWQALHESTGKYPEAYPQSNSATTGACVKNEQKGVTQTEQWIRQLVRYKCPRGASARSCVRKEIGIRPPLCVLTSRDHAKGAEIDRAPQRSSPSGQFEHDHR